ncbi:MAG: DNA gyrase subunit A [Erysipelotrichia bacterium]|jgi:DNA gyrase subunit A|nr:DNA gyrase subunit A [Erysipelotrichia bacterium]
MEDKKLDLVEEVEQEEEKKEVQDGIASGIENVDISDEVRSSFLDYAMSVIVSRAIPDVRDGLKPVHRRIIHGMNESGMQPDKPYKKCARIVGDVMGKYHPHGDSAIYSTLVRLAQPFSMRYTLVDGHGNFGSVDGDEAAAMRYTEARLTKLATEMVRDIGDETVPFVDNYDGTEKEPSVLPSRFPNLLVNGSHGIAVGMATNIPPHNLNETIDAVIAIAKDETLTPLEIMENYLPGPDFPTGATILGRGGIKDAYETGSGNFTLRSKAFIEETHDHRKRIIVYEIPYQVNKAKIIESIVKLVKDKVIEGITEVRDESNKEGIRVVIEVHRNSVPEVILNQLYKNTRLQNSYGITMLSLVDGAPKILPINELLLEYVNYQVEIIRKRTQYRLAKDEARDHVVVGLLTAISNIDEIVEIIKKAATPDEASQELASRFDLTDIQTQAILAMTLRRLTGLENQRLENERKQLEINISKYKEILSTRENIIEVITEELLDIKQRFGDERKTEISNEIASIEDEALIPEEHIVLTLTENNYVKRMTSDTFRTQNRGGRGVRGMNVYEGDIVNILVHTNTHTDVLFFSNLGKVYRLRGYMIPESGRVARGTPIQNILKNLEKDEQIMAIVPVDEYLDDHFLFFITTNGIVKRTAISQFISIRQNGKIAISLREGDSLLDVKCTNGDTLIGLASNNGKMVKFHESDVRSMGRTAAGVKGMNVDDGGVVVSATTSLEGDLILAITQQGYGKMSPAESYRQTKRGAKGVLTINTTEKNGKLVALRAVNGDEDLMIISTKGTIIRIPLTQVAVIGRNTQGVRVIKLDGRQQVSSIAIVPHEEEEEIIEENEDLLEDAVINDNEEVVSEETEDEKEE